eukprot:maker-scaffold_27-snap-gene-4.56-mRNA-1 protein AED:0.14 eAED:0.14 QI:92/1/1/1/1/1/3/64/382
MFEDKQSIKNFCIKWHLPAFLLIGLLIGYAFPYPGTQLKKQDLKGFCLTSDACVYDSIANFLVGIIFIFSGIKLKTEEIKQALSKPQAGIFGIISILLITPLISFVVVLINFKIQEFCIGLAIFFSQATTLSSGPIIAAQAKANVALALLLTVTTNILAVITMPLFVVQSIDIFVSRTSSSSTSENSVSINAAPIILELLFLILVPLTFGKCLRKFESVRNFATDFKLHLKLCTSFFLAVMVWMQISASAEDLKQIDAGSIFAVIALGIIVHLVYLCFNFVCCKFLLSMHEKELRTVVIVASQKTLPVSITVLEVLDLSTIGSAGLVTIPIISSHFVQIVIDAFLAAYWGEKKYEDEVEKHAEKINLEEGKQKESEKNIEIS